MISRFRIFIIAMIVCIPASADAKRCGKPRNRSFQVFNALGYADQPDLTRYGLKPIHIVDRGIWAAGVSRLGPPDPAAVRKYLKSLPDDKAPVVLDFEDYNLIASDQEARSGIAALARIADAFHDAGSERSFGFYGYIPSRDYWNAIAPRDSEKHRKWQTINNRTAALVRHVEVMFPSLYTFYDDQNGWTAYAEAQICEARRISGKPVYVFIWPDFHNNGDVGPPRQISAEYWRKQLYTARKFADGVVIWGGVNFQTHRSSQWDPDAGWWLETLQFIQSLNHHPKGTR